MVSRGHFDCRHRIRCDFSAYPNVVRWLGNMKKLKTWGSINEALYGLASAVKDLQFVAI